MKYEIIHLASSALWMQNAKCQSNKLTRISKTNGAERKKNNQQKFKCVKNFFFYQLKMRIWHRSKRAANNWKRVETMDVCDGIDVVSVCRCHRVRYPFRALHRQRRGQFRCAVVDRASPIRLALVPLWSQRCRYYHFDRLRYGVGCGAATATTAAVAAAVAATAGAGTDSNTVGCASPLVQVLWTMTSPYCVAVPAMHWYPHVPDGQWVGVRSGQPFYLHFSQMMWSLRAN